MMFTQNRLKRLYHLCMSLLIITVGLITIAHAQPTAIVPQIIIYPGQKISLDMIRTVNVTNPNLRPGYAEHIAEVEGFVTNKTLLPGRTIPMSSLREAYIIERGKIVSMVLVKGALTIAVNGVSLENGSLGDIVRARNVDSGIIIKGIVMDNGTLRVMAQ